jgi:RNA processing factor Prp31
MVDCVLLYQLNLFCTGTREFTSSSDLSDILPEEVETKVKEAAEISMGTEISEDDIENIQHLCDQVNMATFISMLFTEKGYSAAIQV